MRGRGIILLSRECVSRRWGILFCMEMQKSFIVLGAQDNEMRTIERLLEAARDVECYPPSSPVVVVGEPLFAGDVHQALGPDGNPVSPRDAASGNWTVDTVPAPGQVVILCELAENDMTCFWREEQGCRIIRLDHHGPGDPPVPTLAQVATLLLLGLRGLVVALADHDLAAAYRLYPLETFDVRQTSFGWSDEQVEAAEKFVASLAPRQVGEGLTIFVGGSSPNNCVADLLIRDVKAGLIAVPSDKEGAAKYVLSGATSAGHVEWLREASTRLGWESYGFPSRGLGGVYVPAGRDVSELFAE